MLHPAQDIKGFAIRATDGDIGQVQDILFDDDHWTVRYLVVDTGTWLPGRRVLISPFAIGRLVEDDQVLTIASTREQVEQSPDVDVHKPVSRQVEAAYARYYGYPFYWGGTAVWGSMMSPYPPEGHVPVTPANHTTPDPFIESEQPTLDTLDAVNPEDVHLRSSHDTRGYTIDAIDGEIGHVEDFLIDDETWEVRYVVVSTSNWWFGNKVLLSPRWFDAINWADGKVSVNLTREAIRNAPAYDPAALPDAAHEEALHTHYGRPLS